MEQEFPEQFNLIESVLEKRDHFISAFTSLYVASGGLTLLPILNTQHNSKRNTQIVGVSQWLLQLSCGKTFHMRVKV